MKLCEFKSFFFVFLIACAFFFLAPNMVWAEETVVCENIDLSAESGNKDGICKKANCDYDGVNHCKTKSTSTIKESEVPNPDVEIQFPNPLAGSDTSEPHKKVIGTTTIIARIISAVLGLLGSVSLLVFLVGGVLYLVSGGEEAKVKKSVDTLKWAFLGLVVVFAAYAILNMILDGLSFITVS